MTERRSPRLARNGSRAERSGRLGNWIEVENTRASPGPANAGESTLLYEFDASVVVPPSCWSNAGEFGWSADLRVREPGAAHAQQLHTFTSQGMACLGSELSAGVEWDQAGASCMTGNTIALYALS